MEAIYDTFQSICDHLGWEEEGTRIVSVVMVGLATSLVTFTTLSLDTLGGPRVKADYNWGRILLTAVSGLVAAAAYVGFLH